MAEYARGYNNSVNVTQVIKYFLVGLKACSTGGETHLVATNLTKNNYYFAK